VPIDQLPVWLNRIFALLILLVLASYIGWVWSAPREIGQGQWKVKLPSGPSTLLQIVIGLFDLGFCTLAMYMLLPNEPHVGFVTLMVVFVSATMLGFASHAPGGLGVFDAAMLVALWQFEKEDLIAGLLVFRLLYYIVPFVFALIILGVREVFFMRGSKQSPKLEKVKVTAPLRSEFERKKKDAG
jgi:glycosyltransferase 2 family protein